MDCTSPQTIAEKYFMNNFLCRFKLHMIQIPTQLQSKALFTFEFIGLGRVLSNLEIPFEALIVIE